MAEGEKKGKQKMKKGQQAADLSDYRLIICDTSSRLICILLPC
ncbi:Uncharacterised protein [Kluyvera ascorbata]|nr:hypothetical protein STW0522KLE44_08810 [Klebsiella sp. STW0522-44]STW97562.1 Uncharacterised protein [Kluyvera ascorbata]